MGQCPYCELSTSGEHASDCAARKFSNSTPIVYPEDTKFEFHQWHPSERQFYAAHAMEAIISNADTMREITRKCERNGKGEEFFEIVAGLAYLYGDAMIEKDHEEI